MAETLGTIKGQMILDVKQALASYTSARQAHIATTVALSTGAAAVTQAGATIAAAGLAMAGGVLAAVNASAKFEKTMDYAAAVSGVTGKAFDALKAKAVQLGQDTIFSAQDIADSFVELAKAGVPAKTIIDGVGDAVAHLGAAADIPLDTAANIITAATQTFSLSADQAVGVADKLAGAANASIVDVQDLGTSFKYAGGTAHALGLSFDDVNTALALLGKAGIKGSTAGTSLRQVMVSLSGSTPKATAALKELGIITEDGGNKFFDAQGKMKPLADVFQILQDAEKGLTSEQQVAIDKAIFQQRAISSVATLTRDGAAGFNEMADAIGRTTAAEVAGKRLNNLAGDIEILKGNIDTLLITAGGGFQNFARFIVQSVTKVVGVFNDLSPAAQTTTLAIVGIVGVILTFIGIAGIMAGQLLNIVNLVIRLGDVTEIAAGIQAVWNGITGAAAAVMQLLNRAMMANPILFIIGLIALFVSALITLMGGWGKVAKFFKPVGDALKQVFQDIMKALGPVTKAFGEVAKTVGGIFTSVFKELVTALLPPLVSLFKAITPILTSVAKIVGDILVPAIGLLTPLFQLVAVVLQVVMAILQPFIGLLTDILVPILNIVAWVLQLVADGVQWLADQIGKFLGSQVPAVLQAFGKVWDNVYNNYIKPFWDNLVKLIQPVVDWWNNTAVPLMTKGMDVLKDAWDNDIKALGLAWQGLQTGLKPIVDWYVNTFIAPLKNSSKDFSDGVVKYAKGSADAWNGFTKGLKVIADWYVNNFINPMVNAGKGFEGFIKEFVKRFDDIKSGVKNALAPAAKAFDDFKNKFEDAKTKVSNAIKPLVDDFQQMRDKIGNAIQQMQDRVAPIVDKFRTMWETLQTKLGPIIDKLKDLFGKIADAINKALGDDGKDAGGGGAGGGGKKKSKADILIDTFTSILTFFLSGAGSALIGILTVLAGILGLVADAISGFAKAIDWAWNNLIKPAFTGFGIVMLWLWNNIINPVLNFIVTTFTWCFDQVMKVVGPVVQWVKDRIGTWAEIEQTVSDIFTNVVNFIKDPFGGIRDFFDKKREEIKGAFANARQWLVQAGKDIIQGLINGLDFMTGGLVSKLGHITGLIPKNKGPERVDKVLLRPSGMWIMQGLIDGIQSQVGSLTSTLQSIGSTVPNSLTGSITASRDFQNLYDTITAGKQLNSTLNAQLVPNADDESLRTIAEALDTIANKDTVNIEHLDVNNPEPEPASKSVPKTIRKAAYIPG